MRIRDCFSCTDNSEYVNLVHRNEKTAKEMEYHEKCLLELEELLQKGGIIALRRTKNRIAPFEVIGFYGDSLDEIYFKLLGRGLGRFSKLGIMYLYARNGESATLKGWHVEMLGHGDGTFFLESVMKYLRRQGYRGLVPPHCPGGKAAGRLRTEKRTLSGRYAASPPCDLRPPSVQARPDGTRRRQIMFSTDKAPKWLAVPLAAAILLLLLCGWNVSGGEADSLGGGLLAASRAELAAVALKEYEQNGNIKGGGKVYWSYWNKGVEAWCVDFVYYCGDQIGLVGQDKPLGPYTAACTTAWSQLKAQGAYLFRVGEDTPRAGDLIFWYSTSGGCAASLENYAHLAHVGIVADYEEKKLTTVEGNTGGFGSANNYVAMKTYTDLYGQSWPGAAIFGFARIQTSANELADWVKAFEGFSKYPFWDYAQYSVGYGTACPADRLDEYRRYGIPESDAEELLEQALLSAVNAVDSYAASAQLTLTTAQRDALASLTYNIGSDWMTSSSYAGFRSAIAAPVDEQTVIQAFANLSHAGGKVLPGLVDRRICEAWLYLHGQYITSSADTGYTYVISGDTVIVERRTP